MWKLFQDVNTVCQLPPGEGPLAKRMDSLDGPQKRMRETRARRRLLTFTLSVEDGAPSQSSCSVCNIEVRPWTDPLQQCVGSLAYDLNIANM